MKQNLGKIDRVLRFALAFWWLGPWAIVSVYTWVNYIMFFIAWVALVESFIGYCWLHDLFGIKNKD